VEFFKFPPSAAFGASRQSDLPSVSLTFLAKHHSWEDDVFMSSLDGRAAGDLHVESQITSFVFFMTNTVNAKELIQYLLHRKSGSLIGHPMTSPMAMAGSVS
jgi:hypothetical protein